jgi:thiamine-phosphate pyrophosphorylase
MVHIGQEDLPYELVHRIAPQLAVGISTHTPEQLTRALAMHPRYVAYGPIFETANKLNPDPVVGVEGLRQASRMARAANVPLVAIGGLTLSRVHEIAPYADAAAVIGDLYPAGASLRDVTERAAAFHAALGGAPRSVEARP